MASKDSSKNIKQRRRSRSPNRDRRRSRSRSRSPIRINNIEAQYYVMVGAISQQIINNYPRIRYDNDEVLNNAIIDILRRYDRGIQMVMRVRLQIGRLRNDVRSSILNILSRTDIPKVISDVISQY